MGGEAGLGDNVIDWKHAARLLFREAHAWERYADERTADVRRLATLLGKATGVPTGNCASMHDIIRLACERIDEDVPPFVARHSSDRSEAEIRLAQLMRRLDEGDSLQGFSKARLWAVRKVLGLRSPRTGSR